MARRSRFGMIMPAVLLAWAAPAIAGEIDVASALEAIRSKHKLPAIAAAVADDERIIASAAIGVRRLGESTSVELQDRFHIGSCTKAMTATMIATLVEAGEMRWETTIAELFPELKAEIHEEYAGVTLEQLREKYPDVYRQLHPAISADASARLD